MTEPAIDPADEVVDPAEEPVFEPIDELPLDADEADVVEQHQPVPVDDDDPLI